MKIKNYPKTWRHFVLKWVKSGNRLFCQMCGHEMQAEYEQQDMHHIICRKCRLLWVTNFAERVE